MLMERRAPALFRTPLQPFGSLLKEWRGRRRKSQLDLALDAGISARHLSFVESGRSTPSRDMVVTLAEALEVPLRDRDGLLLGRLCADVPGEHDRLRFVGSGRAGA